MSTIFESCVESNIFKEEKRLKALNEYEFDIINSEGQLDSITKLLTIICKTPVALVSILDKKKVFIKSKIGLADFSPNERELTLYSYVIDQDDVFEIHDTRKDERFKKSSLITGNPPIIFYAGMPLKTPSGLNIGVLCVIDKQPRKLNIDQKIALKTLAKHVMMYMELTKYNRDLKIANDKANLSVKAKEDFLSNMSHEIRTPLNAIYGFTELLNKTKLNKNQQEMLNIVKSSAEILIAIINDILDFSKIEAGKLMIENHPFNLAEEIRNIQELFSQKVKEKMLSLRLDLDPKIPKIVNGDKVRINQILMNLIGNAIKFTNKGFVELSIKLLEETQTKIGISFCVKDTGIGIPEERKNAIFERFEQASKDITRKYGGTGLGLSICKSLVEMQGGKLGIESKFGFGSSFSFTLYFPKLKDEDIAKIIESNKKMKKRRKSDIKNEKQKFSESLKKHCKKNKLKVLVCEDTIFNYKLIEKIFEDTIIVLDFAENGKEGKEKLEKNEYDLLLLDLQMPIIDGFELTQFINENLKSKILIIAMTANNSELEKKKCFNLGMNYYLTKPFRQKEFLNAVISVMENKDKINITHEELSNKNSKSNSFSGNNIEEDNFINNYNFNDDDNYKNYFHSEKKINYANRKKNEKPFPIHHMSYEIYRTSFSLLKQKKKNGINQKKENADNSNGRSNTIEFKAQQRNSNKIKHCFEEDFKEKNIADFNQRCWKLYNSESKEDSYFLKNTFDDGKILSFHISDKNSGISSDKESNVSVKYNNDNNNNNLCFELSEIQVNSNRKLLDADSIFASELKTELIRNLNKSSAFPNINYKNDNDCCKKQNKINNNTKKKEINNQNKNLQNIHHNENNIVNYIKKKNNIDININKNIENDISIDEEGKSLYFENSIQDLKIKSLNSSFILNTNSHSSSSKNFFQENFINNNNNYNSNNNSYFMSNNSNTLDFKFDIIDNDNENFSKKEKILNEVNREIYSINHIKSFQSPMIQHKNFLDNIDVELNYLKKNNYNDNVNFNSDIFHNKIDAEFVNRINSEKEGYEDLKKNMNNSSKNKNKNINVNNANIKRSRFLAKLPFMASSQKEMNNLKSKEFKDILGLNADNSSKHKFFYRTKSWKTKTYIKSKFIKNSNSSQEEQQHLRNKTQTECEVVLFDFEREENKFDLFTEKELHTIDVNFDCLNEISGGDYLFEKDLISVFLNEFPLKIKSLRKSLEKPDVKEVQILSHSLKSTVAMFGIEILRKRFSELENAVKLNPIDNYIIKKFRENIRVLEKIYLKLKKIFCEKYKDINLVVKGIF